MPLMRIHQVFFRDAVDVRGLPSNHVFMRADELVEITEHPKGVQIRMLEVPKTFTATRHIQHSDGVTVVPASNIKSIHYEDKTEAERAGIAKAEKEKSEAESRAKDEAEAEGKAKGKAAK